MAEMKPCPFCGGRGEFMLRAVTARRSHSDFIGFIKCKTCGSQSGAIGFCDGEMNFAERDSTEAWNRRVSDIND